MRQVYISISGFLWDLIGRASFWVGLAMLSFVWAIATLTPPIYTDEQLAELKAQKAAHRVRGCHLVGGDAQLDRYNDYAGCIIPNPAKKVTP